MDSDLSGTTAVASEYVQLWKARDGTIPILDNPALQFSAHKSETPSLMHLHSIEYRLSSGQIGPPDRLLTRYVTDWVCVTEKQIRHLAKNSFDKAHKIGSRLRMMQKFNWFDSYWFKDVMEVDKEHVWMLGHASFLYFTTQLGMQLIDPYILQQDKHHSLAICAVNEIRMILEDRGTYAEVEYSAPITRGSSVVPFSRFFLQTARGPLTMYVERLYQKRNPLRHMQKKQAMYEQMVEENGGALPMVKPGAAMVVWSVGSLEAIETLVASIDYLTDSYINLFVPDESLHEFPQCFYFAEKGQREGEVELQRLNMNLF